jgi:hypothetical protein
MYLKEVNVADFNKLMEMVTDFGVESLRVGSYEARKALVGCEDWKLSMLRDKRQEARERVAKALWEVCNPAAKEQFPLPPAKVQAYADTNGLPPATQSNDEERLRAIIENAKLTDDESWEAYGALARLVTRATDGVRGTHETKENNHV